MARWRCVVPTHAQRTRYDEVPAYQEGLYELGHGLYAWLVPNGSWGEANGGLVLGDGEALLVDTQWDLQHTRTMLEAMATGLAGRPLRYVVNTHADADHCWGNQLLPSAEIISTEAAAEEMRLMRPGSLLALGVLGRLLAHLPILRADRVGWFLRGLVAPYSFRGIVPTPAGRRFTGEETLSVGGRTVRLIEVGPAHTRGDLLVYVPDARLLFAGDVVFLGSTPLIWDGAVEHWLAALDRILALDVDVVVPGHGPITDKSGVVQIRSYWEFVGREIRRCYEAGMPAHVAAREIALSPEFARQPFATWDSPERIVVSTHAQYRHYAGRTGRPGTLGQLDLMRQQALLAHDLPDAQPGVMRRH